MISDFKIPTATRGTAPFIVDERAVNDYYPYGMLIPERSWSSSDYRYGYNTQEKSLEIDANGNHTTAEFWEYDARRAGRWNPDPVVYPDLSPFQTYRGNPILFSDPYGDDIESEKEAFDRVDDGIKKVLGECHPFSYNSGSKKWELDQSFDISNYDPTQIELFL